MGGGVISAKSVAAVGYLNKGKYRVRDSATVTIQVAKVGNVSCAVTKVLNREVSDIGNVAGYFVPFVSC